MYTYAAYLNIKCLHNHKSIVEAEQCGRKMIKELEDRMLSVYGFATYSKEKL
jgi:hypothetical protein